MRRSWVVLLLLSLLAPSASGPQAQTTKVVFLALADGDGTEFDAYRAAGMGTVPGMGCIFLNLATPRYLCAADTLPATAGITLLGNSFVSTLTPARRTALETALGSTLTSSSLVDVVREILLTRADGVRWKALRAGRDGKYHIYLGQSEAWVQTAWVWDEWHLADGGVVADASNAVLRLLEPPLAWATALAETWNCANSAALDCVLTWTEVSGTGWSITSNQATNSTVGGVRQLARAESALATDDFYVESTLVSLVGTGGGTGRCGVVGRKDTSATLTMYLFAADNDAAESFYDMMTVTNGTHASLGTNPQDQVANDVIRLSMDGSTMTGFVNGIAVIGPITDVSITANLYGGIYEIANITSLSCTQDNWSAGDISAVTPMFRRRMS